MAGYSTTLSFGSLRCGERARIVSIDPAAPSTQRFEELGLTSGTEIQVVKVAPLGDPVEISLRGYRLCLRRKDAEGIRIEKLEN